MIVNQTTISEADQDFIRARLRRQPAVIIMRIIVILISAYLLFFGGLGFYAQFRWHEQPVYDQFWYAVSLALGSFFLYRTIFLKQTARRRDSKAQSLSVPRTYTLDENGISVQYSVNGVSTSAQFAFENAECYWDTADAVYLRVSGMEKKQKRYMCFRDDGYTVGNREELTALLESKGIRRMQK